MAGGNDPNEPVTRGMLNEAINAILNGIENMFGETDKRFDAVDARFDQVDARLDKLEAGQGELKAEVSYIKDEVNGLKVELSDTPSLREFNELKARVDKYHPVA